MIAQKKNIEILIKRIKAATGLTQEGIAKKINYSRPHLSAMKKSNPDDLYILLENFFEPALNVNLTLQEPATTYNSANKMEETSVRINALLIEIAKLKSKVFGISVEDSLDEIEKNIKIALRKTSK